MNKTDLIAFIAKEANLSKLSAATALNAALKGIEGDLKKGINSTILGFGTFSVSKSAAREGRNPKTGKKIMIPAKKVVRFKSGKVLKDAVNK